MRNGLRQIRPAKSRWATLALGSDDRAVPLKADWKKTMPFLPCGKIFSQRLFTV